MGWKHGSTRRSICRSRGVDFFSSLLVSSSIYLHIRPAPSVCRYIELRTLRPLGGWASGKCRRWCSPSGGYGTAGPLERRDLGSRAAPPAIAGAGKPPRKDFDITTVVHQHRVVGRGDVAGAPVVHPHGVRALRRAALRPGDVLVANTIDRACGVRIEIELTAARDLSVGEIHLISIWVDHVEVHVTVGVPRKRHLDVACADLDYVKVHPGEQTDGVGIVGHREEELKLAVPKLLRQCQKD